MRNQELSAIIILLLNVALISSYGFSQNRVLPPDINLHEYNRLEEYSFSSETDSGLTVIQLYRGWNLFSFDVLPTDLSVSSVLIDIDGDFDYVIGFDDGAEVVYDVSSPDSSTLHELSPLQGYYIHMLNPALLIIEGTEVSEGSDIFLSEGIHSISYLPDDDMVVSEALASIIDDVTFVKAIDYNGINQGQRANGGLSYDPELPEFSTLLTMQNGYGYWIKVESDVTLNYPEAPTEVLLASSTIGPEGGSLSTDEFILSIPEGAFSSEVELKLYESTAELNYSDYIVSSNFTLQGLPDAYALPIRIAVKYSGELHSESFIAMGEEIFLPDLLTTEYFPNPFPGVDSLGFLVSMIPGRSTGLQKPTNQSLLEYTELAVSAISSKQHKTNFFRIFYPYGATYESRISEIGDYFDEAIGKLSIAGFDFDNAVSLAMQGAQPFFIYIVDEKNKADYCFSSKPYKAPYNVEKHALMSKMYLNSNNFNLPEGIIRQKAGLLVFGLLQYITFNKAESVEKTKTTKAYNSKWTWFNYAFEPWMAERFSNTPSPFSWMGVNDPTIKFRPFYGMEAGGQPNPAWSAPAKNLFKKTLMPYHGRGMSVFLKYMEENAGTVAVVKTIWDVYKNEYSKNGFSLVDDVIMGFFHTP